ncbi:ABC transporter ATP-binding protein [Xylanibacillus composti]|uniref:ABC transporter domain-containing protein n=1 Tax=Xylanibacillus composti TaxID=1572762 RepID=A0A8J4H474_9BACL|nr:ABC transporter ATP-binding protein [Xylanibacillus composti]MDT9723585.1 ABC transporter ATP-binding protein [Xylanibacillus composti]GIQ68378.1 hypothetical protein XYCOK13_12020 [Xylanibacillus composti]
MQKTKEKNSRLPHTDAGRNRLRAREEAPPVLRVEQLQVAVSEQNQSRLLVQNISFSIRQGEMLAIVGESGSGKSVTAAAIGGLLPKSLRSSGQIWLHNRSLHEWHADDRKRLRGQEIGWVFQNYKGSFTPFMRIGTQLMELVRTHERLSKKEAKARVFDWLEKVGLPPKRVYESYPFQLSGGQCQRVALAAALMPGPSLLIADEPTTALDVLTGERVMDLIAALQSATGCAVLFITHDLRHVWRRADRVAVMKNGEMIESGLASQLLIRPAHPYTRNLLAASPRLAAPGKPDAVFPAAAYREESLYV